MRSCGSAWLTAVSIEIDTEQFFLRSTRTADLIRYVRESPLVV